MTRYVYEKTARITREMIIDMWVDPLSGKNVLPHIISAMIQELDKAVKKDGLKLDASKLDWSSAEDPITFCMVLSAIYIVEGKEDESIEK